MARRTSIIWLKYFVQKIKLTKLKTDLHAIARKGRQHAICSGFPHGVYVGQTRVHHEQTQSSDIAELAGFNLALHVGDNAARVQKHQDAIASRLC